MPREVAPLPNDLDEAVLSVFPAERTGEVVLTPISPRHEPAGSMRHMFADDAAQPSTGENHEGISKKNIMYVDLPQPEGGSDETFATVPIDKNDCRLPVGALIDTLRMRTQVKLFQRYVLYIVLYISFCIFGFDVNSAFNNFRVYQIAMEEVGTPLYSNVIDTEANDWKQSTLPDMIEYMKSFCPTCTILLDTDVVPGLSDDGGPKLQTRQYSNITALTASFGTFDRKQSDPLKLGNLVILRSTYQLNIQFVCNAMVPGFTPEVSCREVFSSLSSGPVFNMWMNLYLLAFVYRIMSVFGDAASYFIRYKYSLGFSAADLVFPWRGPRTLSPLNVLELVTIVLPLWGQVTYYTGDAPEMFQTLMAVNLFFQTAQFYKYAQCWTPFKLLGRTMDKATPDLVDFLIAMVITFLFFAVIAHLLFGNFDVLFRDIVMSVFSVFDRLMNSFPLDTTSPYYVHQPLWSVIYYFTVSFFFLLVMSQFLIAVLCRAFDETVQDIKDEKNSGAVPNGFQLLDDDWSDSWPDFFLGFVWPEAYTCGIVNKLLMFSFKNQERHGETLMSFERLVRVLSGDDGLMAFHHHSRESAEDSAAGRSVISPMCNNPRTTATEIMKKYGCIPVGLASEPELFYTHKPQPFSDEQLAVMKTSFNKFDSHRQNSIDSFELSSCMAYLGMEIDVVDAEDMIAEVDSDGDSKLTFAEFRDVLHAAAKKEHFGSARPMREFSYKAFAYRKFKNMSTMSSSLGGGGGSESYLSAGSGGMGSPANRSPNIYTPTINGRTAGAIGSLESALLSAHLDIKTVQADVGRLHSRADMDVKRLEQKMALMYEVLDQRIASATSEIEGKVDAVIAGMEGLSFNMAQQMDRLRSISLTAEGTNAERS